MNIKEFLRNNEDIVKERLRPRGEMIRVQAYSDACNWYSKEIEKLDKNQQEKIRVESSRSLSLSKDKIEELIYFAAKTRAILCCFLAILLPIVIIFVIIDFLAGLSILSYLMLFSAICCFLLIMLTYNIIVRRIYRIYTEVGAYEAMIHLTDWREISGVNLNHPLI